MVFEKLIVFRGENALWNLGDIKIGGGVHEFVYSECSNNAPVTDITKVKTLWNYL